MADSEFLPEGMTAADLNNLYERWADQGLFNESVEIDTYTSFAGRLPREIRPRELEER